MMRFMNYEVIRLSWSKRRKIDPPREINHIEVINFQKKPNHFCQLKVEFKDGNTETYLSRVTFNEIKSQWIVDGMHVAIRIID